LSELAVVFGGPSPEHDVSILTGLQSVRALGSSGARPRAIYWSKTGEFFDVAPDLEAGAFLDGPPRGSSSLELVAAPGGGFAQGAGLRGRRRPLDLDVVVNCCHGGPGEDGTLQAVFDLAGLRYTGPTVAGAALGMDKLAFGALVQSAGIPCLRREAVGGADASLEGPLIVKPRFGGSSIGIEVVDELATARALLGARPELRRGAVAEPYRADLYDVQVAVRCWPRPELSAIERPLRSVDGATILGYADKYVGGEGMASAPRELPAKLPSAVEEELRRQATRIAELCEVRGVARIDFLTDGSSVYANEMNTIPGSHAKYLWIDPPLSFEELLDGMLEEARERPTHHYTASGADGSALRSAGSIASKLG
jgi:D-alanine-D-alanine ligase